MHIGSTIKTVESTGEIISIENDVKMVIWDLDDTFWNGTLAEGGIEFIEKHRDVVKSLASRGIISSIASNNNYEAAKDILEREGAWDYFVFPSISYGPKGRRVSEIIRNASLRPENVLFVDDNIANLEEVRFFNGGIMLAKPEDFIPIALAHPRLAGKDDLELKRLKQYQLLQRKVADQQVADTSNDAFLRASDIQIHFDFDIETNIDRIVDLVNRSNQLNYTKIRLSTEDSVDGLRLLLNEFGVSAACISCCDRYGDYGVVGFYLLKKKEEEHSLVHFVFSCRIMNMGIERFIYDFLGRPKIAVVPDVAYGLDSPETIDWISVSKIKNKPAVLVSNRERLLLVGGCELLQLGSFCSSNRVEFVNKIVSYQDDDYKVRYDDPYFFITDREKLRRSGPMKRLASWTCEDAILLDRSIVDTDIIILAMRSALNHVYIVTDDGIHVRMERSNIELYRQRDAAWFERHFSIVSIPTSDKLSLIRKAFEAVGRRSSSGAVIFIIGAHMLEPEGAMELARSGAYNNCCRELCQNNPKFHFVDVTRVVAKNQLIRGQHLTREGYHALSVYIMTALDAKRPEDAAAVG